MLLAQILLHSASMNCLLPGKMTLARLLALRGMQLLLMNGVGANPLGLIQFHRKTPDCDDFNLPS